MPLPLPMSRYQKAYIIFNSFPTRYYSIKMYRNYLGNSKIRARKLRGGKMRDRKGKTSAETFLITKSRNEMKILFFMCLLISYAATLL